MKKIKLRTKIEITLAFFFLILLAVTIVISVTDPFSSGNDDFDHYIHNSNGNYWEPTGNNIQAAIDDLENGGTVRIGTNVTISSPIRPKDNVILDFQNHEVTLENDIEFVYMTACKHASIKNARVTISSGHTSSIILLYIPPGSTWDDRVRYNTFENIYIQNPSHWTPDVGWDDHYYTGIHLKILGDTSMLYNTFRDIQIEGAGIGIRLECDARQGWGNGNNFENIWIDQFVTMVWFEVSARSVNGFNKNVFLNVKGQAVPFSIYGFRDISRNGNHFDHCLVWDWHLAQGTYDWIVSNDAQGTYICAHGIANILDNGSETEICK